MWSSSNLTPPSVPAIYLLSFFSFFPPPSPLLSICFVLFFPHLITRFCVRRSLFPRQPIVAPFFDFLSFSDSTLLYFHRDPPCWPISLPTPLFNTFTFLIARLYVSSPFPLFIGETRHFFCNDFPFSFPNHFLSVSFPSPLCCFSALALCRLFTLPMRAVPSIPPASPLPPFPSGLCFQSPFFFCTKFFSRLSRMRICVLMFELLCLYRRFWSPFLEFCPFPLSHSFLLPFFSPSPILTCLPFLFIKRFYVFRRRTSRRPPIFSLRFCSPFGSFSEPLARYRLYCFLSFFFNWLVFWRSRSFSRFFRHTYSTRLICLTP